MAVSSPFRASIFFFFLIIVPCILAVSRTFWVHAVRAHSRRSTPSNCSHPSLARRHHPPLRSNDPELHQINGWIGPESQFIAGTRSSTWQPAQVKNINQRMRLPFPVAANFYFCGQGSRRPRPFLWWRFFLFLFYADERGKKGKEKKKGKKKKKGKRHRTARLASFVDAFPRPSFSPTDPPIQTRPIPNAPFAPKKFKTTDRSISFGLLNP